MHRSRTRRDHHHARLNAAMDRYRLVSRVRSADTRAGEDDAAAVGSDIDIGDPHLRGSPGLVVKASAIAVTRSLQSAGVRSAI